jgi:hypothetical protein
MRARIGTRVHATAQATERRMTDTQPSLARCMNLARALRFGIAYGQVSSVGQGLMRDLVAELERIENEQMGIGGAA